MIKRITELYRMFPVEQTQACRRTYFNMSTFAINRRVSRKDTNPIGLYFVAGYFVLYAVILYAMNRFGGFEAGEALGVFGILGVGFSLMAWLLTIGVKPLAYEVKQPGQELSLLLLYMLPLAAFVAYGFAAIHRWVVGQPTDSLAILLAKLLVFVVVPVSLMRYRFGYRWSDLAAWSLRPSHMWVFVGMALVLLIFQSLAGRGLRDITAAHVASDQLLLGVPLVFIWLCIEVGVVEEFFFRVLLQSRLSAALRSELGGIVLMALLFGLVHAPGLYLRTGITQEGLSSNPSLWMAVGYSIVITSVAGFFLGVLWARTRNFLVLVLLHAAADLLPNTLPTLRAFHLLN